MPWLLSLRPTQRCDYFFVWHALLSPRSVQFIFALAFRFLGFDRSPSNARCRRMVERKPFVEVHGVCKFSKRVKRRHLCFSRGVGRHRSRSNFFVKTSSVFQPRPSLSLSLLDSSFFSLPLSTRSPEKRPRQRADLEVSDQCSPFAPPAVPSLNPTSFSFSLRASSPPT